MYMENWKTLLLDVSNQPVDIIPWTEAMFLLVTGKADVVVDYENIPIRSEKLTFKLPSIMKLRKFFRRNTQVQFSRYNIFYRDDWKCQYCGTQCKSSDLTFDHVVPKSQGGKKTWENIVAACFTCNHSKRDRTPKQAGMKLIREPKKPKWMPKLIIRLKDNHPAEWRDYLYWNVPLEIDG